MEVGQSLCCRSTHVISSVPLKDHIIVVPRSFHLAGWITHSDHKAE
jgi:hypothetical protein